MDFVFKRLFFFLLQLTALVLSEIPEITNHPVNMTVIRGEPVTLECRVTGSPTPLIEWYKDGKKVKENSSPHRLFLPDGSLLFLRVIHSKRESDSGVYYCSASNEDGTVKSTEATLEVAYMRDEFRAVPRDTEAILGKDVVLECSPPVGNPEPVVKWKKDGDNLDLTSSKRIKIDGNGNLLIKAAEKSDEGRYQCSAGNIANKRTSKAVRVNVNQIPFFLSSPKDVNVIAGEEAFIDCRLGGDPYPDVTWTKERGDIDISKLKIVNGKGLRIKNVDVADSGRYICTAKNKVGVVSASSYLTVSVPPIISIQDSANVQVRALTGSVKLNCLVAGSPAPFSFWSKETEDSAFAILPGEEKDGIAVTNEGTLIIKNPETFHSGHYSCTAVNDVGSAIARYHVLVYDPLDRDSFHSRHSGLELDEARVVTTMEDGVRIGDISAVSSTSLKLQWFVTARHKYLEGFFIRYRRTEEPALSTIKVLLSGSKMSSFLIENLEEHSEYEVFVQPFFKNIVGKPASIKRIITHPDLPSEAPVIREARLLNISTIFLSWSKISSKHLNGPIKGYEILIRGNGTAVNNTVDGDTTEVTVIVNGMAPYKIYTIQISVINSVGHGPFSSPLEISKGRFDESPLPVPHSENEVTKMTWIIAIVAILTFVLIFMSGIFFYKRKFHDSRRGKSLPSGYLPTSTSAEEFHCQLYQKNQGDRFHQTGIWIDRDYEKSSNSSEKKLLSMNDARNPQSSANSDTEYAYVDNKHNLSSFTTSSGASSSDRKTMESPEPYATADILQTNYSRPLSTKSGPCCNSSCHYADPIVVARRCHRGESHSCDNLLNESRQVPNLLEILPPPPLHPPPPPSSYGRMESRRSHESVISPKYLLHHPSYQPGEPKSTPRSKRKNRASEKPSFEGFSSSSSSTSSKRNPDRIYGHILKGEEGLQSELESFNDAVLRLQRRASPSSDEDIYYNE